jgi:hypothetical protein
MSSAPSTGRISTTIGSKLTKDEMDHLLDIHLSVTRQGDTLVIVLSPGCDEERCTISDRVVFFNCHQPPCPAIIVSPHPQPPPPQPDSPKA